MTEQEKQAGIRTLLKLFKRAPKPKTQAQIMQELLAKHMDVINKGPFRPGELSRSKALAGEQQWIQKLVKKSGTAYPDDYLAGFMAKFAEFSGD